MAKSCVFRPKIRNKDGEMTDSILFGDLMKSTPDRESCVKLWGATRTQSFRDEILPGLETDINGEPTFESLYRDTELDMEAYIPREYIEKRAGVRDERKKDTEENRDKATRQAIQFNKESPFRHRYLLMPQRGLDEKTGKRTVGLTLSLKNEENTTEADKMAEHTALNDKLRALLEEWGVDVGVLSEAEEAMGIDGVMEYDRAKELAQGIIAVIRIARGEKGETALPEEFSHFLVRAMYDHPLVRRLMSIIDSNDLVKEILGAEYDSYARRYEEDRARLVEECAGKLLARHLTGEAVPQSPYKTILQRAIAAVKAFFRRFNETEVEKAMREAEGTLDSLTRMVMNKKIAKENLNLSRIREAKRLYSLTVGELRDADVALKKILDTEKKKDYMLRSDLFEGGKDWRAKLETFVSVYNTIFGQDAGPGATVTDQQVYQITSMAKDYLDHFAEDIEKGLKRLADDNYAMMNTQQKASILRDMKNIVRAFRSVSNDIFLLNDATGKVDALTAAMQKLGGLADELDKELKKQERALFSEYLTPVYGDIFKKRKKKDGEPMTIDDIFDTLEEDLTWGQRWLDSAADSSSDFLKIIDQMVKKAKNKARLKSLQQQKAIRAAGLKLRKAGVTDFEWMFEKDEHGEKTGYYISPIHWGQLDEAYETLKEKLNNSVIAGQMTKKEMKKYLRDWFEKESDPTKTSFYNVAFDAEMSNNAKKVFYNTIINMKQSLDRQLPRPTTAPSIIMIRKGLMERVLHSKGVKSGAKQVWEALKDEVARRSDDTDFGNAEDEILTDFEGQEHFMLPMYFTRMRESEELKDMSTDVVSTMIAYSAMANEYVEMNKQLDLLEVGRDIARDIQVNRTNGNHVVSDIVSKLPIHKRSEDSYFLQRLNDYFKMQVYGRYMDNTEGTLFDGISVTKLAHFINKFTALKTLAFNLTSAFSNITMGVSMMNIEAAAREFFNPSDLLRADRTYTSALPHFLGEIGARVHTSKLFLFDELFNVMQDYDVEARDEKFDRRNRLTRLAGWSALFFLNTAGEHWMQNRTMLALAMHEKLLDADGNEITLWDALEVVDVDSSDPSLGKKIQLRKGIKDADGNEFDSQSWTDYVYALTRKSAAINERLHGIYNNIDKSAMQYTAVGILVILYRKWLRPYWNRRYRKATYNYDLDTVTEGFYYSFGKFLLSIKREMKGLHWIAATKSQWQELEDYQKKNIIRALTELGHIMLMTVILGLIDGGGDGDDDDERTWAESEFELQCRRLYTELVSTSPTLGMPTEALKILKSPAAGIDAIEDTFEFFDVLNFNNYEWYAGEDALIQKGQYKGCSRAERAFWNMLPLNKTLYRAVHPEESVPYYK